MHSHFSGSERNGNLTPTDETRFCLDLHEFHLKPILTACNEQVPQGYNDAPKCKQTDKTTF